MEDALQASLSSLLTDRFTLDTIDVEGPERLGSALHKRLRAEPRVSELKQALDRLIDQSPTPFVRFFPDQSDDGPYGLREREKRKLARRCVGYFWTRDDPGGIKAEAFVQPVPEQLIFLDGDRPVSNQFITAIHETVHAYCHNNEGIEAADALFAEAHAVRTTGCLVSNVGELLFVQFVDELLKSIRGCMNGLYRVARDDERQKHARTLLGHAAVFEHDDFCRAAKSSLLMGLAEQTEREWYLTLLPELLDEGLYAILSRVRSEAEKNGNLKAYKPYRPILYEAIEQYRTSGAGVCELEQDLQHTF